MSYTFAVGIGLPKPDTLGVKRVGVILVVRHAECESYSVARWQGGDVVIETAHANAGYSTVEVTNDHVVFWDDTTNITASTLAAYLLDANMPQNTEWHMCVETLGGDVVILPYRFDVVYTVSPQRTGGLQHIQDEIRAAARALEENPWPPTPEEILIETLSLIKGSMFRSMYAVRLALCKYYSSIPEDSETFKRLVPLMKKLDSMALQHSIMALGLMYQKPYPKASVVKTVDDCWAAVGSPELRTTTLTPAKAGGRIMSRNVHNVQILLLFTLAEVDLKGVIEVPSLSDIQSGWA